MFQSDKDYLSICISDQSVKIAQVKSSGAVVKVSRREIAGMTNDAAAQALKTALSGFSPKKAHVLCVIPASVATTKTIEVPSIDPEEIKSIVNLQAARHTPFSRDEILVGHCQLGSYQSNFTKIFLVIVNRNVVKERLRIIESAGLETYKVVFEPEGIARFYAKALGVKRESAPVGIIDVGPQATNVIIESRGTAAMCRSIPVGTAALTNQGAEARDKLVAEIKKSLDSYREEDIDKAPATFLLTSSQAIVKDLQPSLAAAVASSVQISAFIDQLKIGGGLKKKLESEFANDTLSDVLAPAVSAARCEVNLIPEEILMKRGVEQQSREVMVTGVLVVSILLLIGLILGSKNYFKETFLKKNLREKYAGQHEEVLALQAELQRTKAVQELLNSRLTALKVLRGLYVVIPKDIYLNSITSAEDGIVVITGIAETTSRVYSFVSSLSESKIFDGVKTKSTSAKKDRGKDMVSFEVEFLLNPNYVEEDLKDEKPVKPAGPAAKQGIKGT